MADCTTMLSNNRLWLKLLLLVLFLLTAVVLFRQRKNNAKFIHFLSDTVTALKNRTKIYPEKTEIAPKNADIPILAGVELQKKLYQYQQPTRQGFLGKLTKIAHISNAYIAEVNCPYLARLGHPDDGGKWVCNPWKLPKKCVIYALGVGGDVSFEKDLNFVTESRCTIVSFDPNAGFKGLFAQFTNVDFKPWLIAANTDEAKNSYRIVDAMKKLGHANVDLFKMDIEGSEHDVVPELFKQGFRPCQFTIEIHDRNAAKHPQNVGTLTALLKEFAKADYLNYSKEHNGYWPDLIEFSFIHKNCLAQYEISVILHKNFAV